MAMAVDNRQQSHLSSLGYDTLRYQAPQFTNPWVANVTGAPSSQLYASSLPPNSTAERNAQQAAPRPTTIPMPYSALPVTAASLGAGTSLPGGSFEQQNLLGAPQDLLNPNRAFGSQYPTSATLPQFSMDYTSSSRSPYTYAQDPARRSSHPSVNSAAFLGSSADSQRQRPVSMIDSSRLNPQQARNSFSDALDASQGMVAMSQSDITPRNIYGNQGSSRSSSDSYGFPATHSSHSSISSASYNPSYYSGSVGEGSVTDYSSASESVDLNSRTLPRPSSLVGTNLPPAPQSMMGQFSSKVSSSSQKKHKCKICDKRFTRPSSLQTHMYSHTGEKPFACEVEGCGRHFSVVSNLRRHRKVHKSEHDHPSPDDS